MWYKILAPKVFNEQEIGQTLGSNLVGRVVKLPLSRLIDDITKQHIHLFLRLKEVEDGVVRTEIKGYELSRAYLARLVRRRTSRIDSIDRVPEAEIFAQEEAFSIHTESGPRIQLGSIHPRSSCGEISKRDQAKVEEDISHKAR